MALVALPLLFLSAIGILYTGFAALSVARFARRPVPPPVAAEPVTLLKPLHGPEPRLAAKLASFLDQDWAAPITMVAGVQRGDDPAIAVARSLGPAVRLVVDGTRHGGNAKVSNLVNMWPHVVDDLVVLSDSDMSVGRDYLATLAAALARPGVGAVTCAYRGRGDAGFWSELAAAGISYHFVPQLLVGLRLGLARPGMGSTIALRARTLDAIGGFRPFADALADDYALADAVRAAGLRVEVPALLLTHGCTETSLAALWRHELRWAATILRINPAGQIGTIVTFPVPFALVALPFAPAAALALLAAALLARLALVAQVDRLAAARTAPRRLILLRDCLSLAVFLLSFCARSVEWRGLRLKMADKGRIAPEPESFR